VSKRNIPEGTTPKRNNEMNWKIEQGRELADELLAFLESITKETLKKKKGARR